MAITKIEVATVQAIIDTDLPDAEIQTLIDMVYRMISVIAVNNPNCQLTDEQWQDIQSYLVAHMIAGTKERQAVKEDAGTASIQYAGKLNETGLNSTTYGQMAKMLDTCGVLDQLGKRRIQIIAVNQVTDPGA